MWEIGEKSDHTMDRSLTPPPRQRDVILGPKWNKFGTFSDQISLQFGSVSYFFALFGANLTHFGPNSADPEVLYYNLYLYIVNLILNHHVATSLVS